MSAIDGTGHLWRLEGLDQQPHRTSYSEGIVFSYRVQHFDDHLVTAHLFRLMQPSASDPEQRMPEEQDHCQPLDPPDEMITPLHVREFMRNDAAQLRHVKTFRERQRQVEPWAEPRPDHRTDPGCGDMD